MAAAMSPSLLTTHKLRTNNLAAPVQYSALAGITRPVRRRLLVRPVSALSVTPEYGYVIVSVAASAALVQWQAVRVGLARRTFNVMYPQMYATGEGDDARTFNCIQRAHQNTLETLPALLAMEALLGLTHPLAAAALGMLWNIGRVAYTLGYSTGDPNKRLPGIAVAGLTYVAMIIATASSGLTAAGVLGGSL